MTTDSSLSSRPNAREARRLRALAVALVVLRLALPLLLIHPAWEFHRDEFLYFAMGDHLEWFRMQFPPLIAVVARISRGVFGDAVWAARVPAALAGASLLGVLLWLARRLGGGAWSLIVIALGTVAAPVFLRPSVLMHPVIFDQLWATLAFAALVLSAVERAPRWWVLVGFAFGLGALTKFSVAFYILAAGAATLGIPALRVQLATRRPWVAAAIALLIAVPSLAGQVAHDWPFLQQMQALRGQQLERVTAAAFLTQQPLMLGGAALIVPLGVVAAVRGDRASQVTLLLLASIVALMLVLHGKEYYAGPAYPVVLVTGAVWLDRQRRAEPRGASVRVVQWGLPPLVVVMALLALPLGVPLLAPAAMARYASAIGVSAAVRTNQGDVLPLPQDYADMLGWRAQAAAVGKALHALTPEEQRDVLLVGSNYGEAGALAMYRERFGLPYPVSVAGDFHAWGTYGHSGNVSLLIDGPEGRARFERLFSDVREVERIEEPRAVGEEQDLRVFLARRPRAPVDSVWRTLGPRWN